MPFCTKCGSEVRDRDRFCRSCGQSQPSRHGPPSSADATSPPVSPLAASILCYIPWLGWMAAAYVLLAPNFYRENREVRFHAYQGIYIFVAWMLVHWVLRLWFGLIDLDHVPQLLELMAVVLWVFMLIKTSAGQRVSLPVIGELAERSL